MRRIILFVAIASVLLGFVGQAIALTILNDRSPEGHRFVVLDARNDSPSKACKKLYPSMRPFDAFICGLVAMARKHLTNDRRIDRGTVLEFSDTRAYYTAHTPATSKPSSKNVAHSPRIAHTPQVAVSGPQTLWPFFRDNLWLPLVIIAVIALYLAGAYVDKSRDASEKAMAARRARFDAAKLERSEGALRAEIVEKTAKVNELSAKLLNQTEIHGAQFSKLMEEKTRLQNEVERLEGELRRLREENNKLRAGSAKRAA